MFSLWLITICRNPRKYAGGWSLGVKIQNSNAKVDTAISLCACKLRWRSHFYIHQRVSHKYVQKSISNQSIFQKGSKIHGPWLCHLTIQSQIPAIISSFPFGLPISRHAPTNSLMEHIHLLLCGIDTLSLCNTITLANVEHCKFFKGVDT